MQDRNKDHVWSCEFDIAMVIFYVHRLFIPVNEGQVQAKSHVSAISLAICCSLMHIRICAHFQSLEHLGGGLIVSVNNSLNHHGAGWHRNIVVDEGWFPANISAR